MWVCLPVASPHRTNRWRSDALVGLNPEMIVDSAQILVKSGKGGDGCVSFLRMKYIPKGGPNGGDGGGGGSVDLLADPEVETLLDFAGRHHWKAQNGEAGRGKSQHGKKGEDLVVRLPPGTLVYHADTDELLVDLNQEGMTHRIAEGGKGGRGNERFATPTHQTPREAEPGGEAVEIPLRLELKLIADVGLVGKPNAGKSTLLSAVSAATPKIADYPFTTMVPQLGIAELVGGGVDGYGRRLVVADIPGLIENASGGAGLGTRFLRHIERTRLLVHLLDPQPDDGTEPADNYYAVRQELVNHSPLLAQKRELIALSKMDLVGDEEDHAAAKQILEEQLGKPVLTFSAASRLGLTELLEAAWSALHPASDAAAPGWKKAPAP